MRRDTPILALLSLEFGLDHTDHNVVPHESTRVHNLFSFDAQSSLLSDLRAQHIPSSEMTHAELVPNTGCLSALPSTRRPNQDSPQPALPRRTLHSALSFLSSTRSSLRSLLLECLDLIVQLSHEGLEILQFV